MSFWKTTWTVLGKDLGVELRSKEIALSAALFAVLVVLITAFAFGPSSRPAAESAAAALWIAVAFSGVLVFGRSFAREREFDAWTSLLLTPAPRPAIYLGKLLGCAAILLVVEAVLVLAVQLFFGAPFLGHAGEVALILVLATTGYASVGALFAAMTVRSRLRDVLLGTVLFPLVTPILIAACKATTAVTGGAGLAGAADYLRILAVCDVVFLVGGLWMFGPLVED